MIRFAVFGFFMIVDVVVAVIGAFCWCVHSSVTVFLSRCLIVYKYVRALRKDCI